MTKLRVYVVRFCEWGVYEARIEATSEGAAIRRAMAELSDHGTKSFKLKDGGEESWDAEVVS